MAKVFKKIEEDMEVLERGSGWHGAIRFNSHSVSIRTD